MKKLIDYLKRERGHEYYEIITGISAIIAGVMYASGKIDIEYARKTIYVFDALSIFYVPYIFWTKPKKEDKIHKVMLLIIIGGFLLYMNTTLANDFENYKNFHRPYLYQDQD